MSTSTAQQEAPPIAPEQSTQPASTQPLPTLPLHTQPPQQQTSHGQQPAFVPYLQYQQSYGRPFQPYQQQTYTQQQEQQRPEEKKAWTWAKFGLHAVDIIFCICGLAITFSMIGHGETGYIFLACCPVLVLALIWDIAELITRCARKFKHGIHPGAHVALSLIIWLGAGIVGGIEFTWIALSDNGYSSSCWDYDTQSYDNCDRPFDGRKAQATAVAVFTCLVWLAHFILFVGACVDTAKRNAFARRPIIVAGGPPYWGPMAQGWQPMPQYVGNAQGQYMTAPQQNIPLETRSPSSGQGNGKGVEQSPPQGSPRNPTVTEYYTPTEPRS